MKKVSTKKALISSLFSFALLTGTMVLGGTFAWFTSQAKNEGNKIQAGSLEILFMHDVGQGYEQLPDVPLFTFEEMEPGQISNVENLRVFNNGTINIAFDVSFDFKGAFTQTSGLEEYIYVVIDGVRVGTISQYLDFPIFQGALEPQKAADFTLALEFAETADNALQNAEIPTFDIVAYATQLTNKNYVRVAQNVDELNAAVSDASVNFIYVKEGIYDAQVTVTNRKLSIIGEAKDKVIFTTENVTPVPYYAGFNSRGTDGKEINNEVSYLGHMIFVESQVMIRDLTIQGNEEWILANNLYSGGLGLEHRFVGIGLINSSAIIHNVDLLDLEYVRRDGNGNIVTADYGAAEGFGISVLLETHPHLAQGEYHLSLSKMVIDGFRKGGVLVREFDHGYVADTYSTQIKLVLVDEVVITGLGEKPEGAASLRAQPGIECSAPLVITDCVISAVFDGIVVFGGVPYFTANNQISVRTDASGIPLRQKQSLANVWNIYLH